MHHLLVYEIEMTQLQTDDKPCGIRWISGSMAPTAVALTAFLNVNHPKLSYE